MLFTLAKVTHWVAEAFSGDRSLRSLHAETEEFAEEEDFNVDIDMENAGGQQKIVAMEALGIVLTLISLTILFEKGKHHIEHSAGAHMKPIVKALFGELTVLGFLSTITYVLEQVGFFEVLSEAIKKGTGEEEEGGEEAEDEQVFELFETIHFSMFLVMVIFMVQVLSEVSEGLESQEEWCQWDRACQDPIYVEKLLEANRELDKDTEEISSITGVRGALLRAWRYALPYLQFLPFLRNHRVEDLVDKMEFCSLRTEFYAERSLDPPFAPAGTKGEPSKVIGEHFNFGRYLTYCYTRKMAHVVEIDVHTWVFFAASVVSYFILFSLIFDFSSRQLANVWLAIGWVMYMAVVRFEQYLLAIRDRFLAPQFIPSPKRRELSSQNLLTGGDGAFGTEEEPLNGFHKHSTGGLPMWCLIDPVELDLRRSRLSKLMFGPTPTNRQHALYCFFAKGPSFHIFCLRVALLFSCVYTAQFCIVFVPTVWNDEETTFLGFAVYAMLSLIPTLSFIFNQKRLISVLIQVGSVGSFQLPQAIAHAEKEEKTSMAVRVLVMVFKVSKMANEFLANPNSYKLKTNYNGHYMTVFSAEEIAELGRIFTMFFDPDNDGTMSGEEFRSLMALVGIPMGSCAANKLVGIIARSFNFEGYTNVVLESDLENMGLEKNEPWKRNEISRAGFYEPNELSREGFFQWYANQLSDSHDERECAEFVFKLFDDDGSGDITVFEFRQCLEMLNIGISPAEADSILQELDEDGNGALSMEEFEDLFERFYPAECKHQGTLI